MNQAKDTQQYEFLADDPNVNVKPIMISLIIGAFFAILNETLLNIALVSLMDAFHISVITVQWMITGFMLVTGVMTPISALLSQWMTTRQMFLGTMIIFTFGTLVCALAPSFPILLTGRLFQAIGTGLIMPSIFNIFLYIYPPEKRGRMMGIISLVIMFAPSIGPTLSGIIVEHLGWRYLFILVIPFALFSVLFAFKYLVNVTEVTKPKIDILSIILSMIGLSGIILGFGFVGKGETGFANPMVYLPILIGLITLTLFVQRQRQLDEPLLDLSVFRFPMYRLGVFLFLIIIMVMFSSEILLPMYMQGPLALSAATAGLILLPGSLLSGILSPYIGQLFDKWGPRKLLIPSTGLLCGTMFILSTFNVQTPTWFVVTCYALLMLSVVTIMTSAETNGLNQLPKAKYPHGTAIMMTLQPIAGAMGVSLSVSLMKFRQNVFLDQTTQPNHPSVINEAFISGLEWVYLISFVLTIFTLLISFYSYRATPSET